MCILHKFLMASLHIYFMALKITATATFSTWLRYFSEVLYPIESYVVLLLTFTDIQAYIILLACFFFFVALLHYTDVAFFYKSKAKPSISKNIRTCFIAIVSLLRWSGTKPEISPRYPSMMYI